MLMQPLTKRSERSFARLTVPALLLILIWLLSGCSVDLFTSPAISFSKETDQPKVKLEICEKIPPLTAEERAEIREKAGILKTALQYDATQEVATWALKWFRDGQIVRQHLVCQCALAGYPDAIDAATQEGGFCASAPAEGS